LPELVTPSAPSSTLLAKHVYALAAISLAAGLAIGFVCFGTGAVAAAPSAVSTAAPAPAKIAGSAHPVSLADMKHMADQQAAPLLQQLHANPADAAILAQLGAIYHLAHQYKEAVDWYSRAVQAAPKDVALRTRLATSLYRAGDPDGAIAQLDEALKLDPRDPNSLFNLGIIRLQGKSDARGALAAWRQLLKSNPDLAPDRKASVQTLIAQVTASLNAMQAQGGPVDGRR
jgi:cytochrome c-type biogenesis protein CcmH/NrfG